MIDRDELFKLSIDERIKLAMDLWDSVAAEQDKLPPLTAAQMAEIDRRIAEYEADPSSALDWKDIHRDLEA